MNLDIRRLAESRDWLSLVALNRSFHLTIFRTFPVAVRPTGS
jgi:hypothetical protein